MFHYFFYGFLPVVQCTPEHIYACGIGGQINLIIITIYFYIN